MARGQKIRSGTVQVDGLPELSRALKAIGPDARRELREASKSVAEFVAADARSGAQVLGGVAAKSAPSIGAVGGVAGAGVAFGGASSPWAAGAEFGGGRRPTTRQFEPWRGNGETAGYFVYPAIRSNAERIESEFTDAIDGIIKRRFPNEQRQAPLDRAHPHPEG